MRSNSFQRRFITNRRFLSLRRRLPGGIAVSCSLFHPNLSKKSPPAQQDQSGGGCEIWQYINEFVISCACVALCRAGAFCYLHFETKCSEVRSSSPGCRSPPSPVSVTRSPNTETEVYNDYHQSERFLLLVHPGSVY